MIKDIINLECTCVVPFYNEGNRVREVIIALKKVKNISQIICVDDGSESLDTASQIKKEFKDIVLVRLPKNKGKSAAVKAGLDLVKTPLVILIDADLKGLKKSEIEHSINAMKTDKSLGMVILKRIKEPWYIKLTRWDTLVSGERVLYTDDLRQIYKRDFFLKNQIEYAINRYMMVNNKKVRWAPSSAENVYKIYKYGIISGILQDLKIHLEYIKYGGVIFSLRSYFLFCTKSVGY